MVFQILILLGMGFGMGWVFPKHSLPAVRRYAAILAVIAVCVVSLVEMNIVYPVTPWLFQSPWLSVTRIAAIVLFFAAGIYFSCLARARK
jgi:hypothetical protein